MLSTFFGLSYLHNIAVIALLPVLHGLRYSPFVESINILQKTRDHGAIVWCLYRPWIFYSTQAPNTFHGSRWVEGGVLFRSLNRSRVHHYFIDSFLWRMRNKESRVSLG